MKALVGIAVAIGLLVVWRKPAAKAASAAQSASGLDGAKAEAAGLQTSDAAQVDVTNATNNEQNTVTLGNGAEAEVGGNLTLGGSGGLATGNGGSGSGSDISTTQNNVTLGENAVLHVGSGRRPARESDYGEFFAEYRTRELFPVRGGTPSNPRIGNASLESVLPAPGLYAWDALKTTLVGGDTLGALAVPLDPITLEALSREWNNFFGNSVAFPGQPIN